jgi:type VI secretion system lysozyme-like protein
MTPERNLRYPLSVWNRLTSPTLCREPDVAEVLARDLERLLNTVPAIPREQLAEDLHGSLLAYGLAWWTRPKWSGQEAVEGLRQAILQAVADHEPRLANVVVEARKPGRSVACGFQLRAELGERAVKFQVTFDPDDRVFAIKRIK